MVSALDFQAEYRRFESSLGRDNFQTISTPSSYSACPGLSIKWTGRRLVTDSGTKCAWVIHESKAVQIHVHVHNNRRCLYVPQVPGSVKNLHNNKQQNCLYSRLILNIFIHQTGTEYTSIQQTGTDNCLYSGLTLSALFIYRKST